VLINQGKEMIRNILYEVPEVRVRRQSEVKMRCEDVWERLETEKMSK
jgi:hypothetical protein